MNRRCLKKSIAAMPLAIGLCVLCGAVFAQNIERVRLTDNDLNCAQIYAEVQQMDMMVRLGPPAGQAAVAAMPASPVAAPAPVAEAPSQLPSQLGGLFGALAGAAASRSGNVGAAQLFGGIAGAGAPAVAGMPTDVQGLMNDQASREVLLSPSMQQSIARARAAGMSDAQIMATIQPAINARRAALAANAPQPAAQVYGSQVAMPVAAAPGVYAAGAAYAPQAGGYGAQAPRSTAQQAQARKEHLTGLFLGKGCRVADVQK